MFQNKWILNWLLRFYKKELTDGKKRESGSMDDSGDGSSDQQQKILALSVREETIVGEFDSGLIDRRVTRVRTETFLDEMVLRRYL